MIYKLLQKKSKIPIRRFEMFEKWAEFAAHKAPFRFCRDRFERLVNETAKG